MVCVCVFSSICYCPRLRGAIRAELGSHCGCQLGHKSPQLGNLGRQTTTTTAATSCWTLSKYLFRANFPRGDATRESGNRPTKASWIPRPLCRTKHSHKELLEEALKDPEVGWRKHPRPASTMDRYHRAQSWQRT